MKTLLFAGLFCVGTLASASNLSIDFTQNPTAFNFSGWDTSTSTTSTFSGTFFAAAAETGSDNVAVVDENTGELLEEIMLNFTSDDNDGLPAEETFSGSVIAGIDSGFAPLDYIVEDATGLPVDFTADLIDNGPFPTDVALQETEDSPSDAPEPASFVLVGLGLVGVSLARRRAKSA
jgi:hypothetical protein